MTWQASTGAAFRFVSAVLISIATFLPSSAGAQTVGEIFDPTGDSIGAGGTADLVSASITVVGADLLLQVRFAPGTFDAAATAAQFLLDTDMNAATGSPGTDNACTAPDNAILGTDWLVEPRASSGTVRILQATGGCNSFVGVPNTLSATEVADGMDLVLPLAIIGGDDGRLHFKVLSMTFVGPGSNQFTGVQDKMSNPGLPAGVVGGPPDTSLCVRDETTACLLDGRFEVKVTMWNLSLPPVLFPGRIQTYEGATSETEQSVSFYSFQEGNVEIFVKMVPACAHPSLPGFWLFAAGATNTETEILVRDTETGDTQRIHNPRAHLFETVANTSAFLDCP